MKVFTAIIVLQLISGTYTGLYAQLRQDANDFSGWLYMDKPAKNYSVAANNLNAEEFVFSNLFMLYKTFVSSQDGNVCVFSPSCSEFALAAVKKHGALPGIIMGFDRLTRCNAFARGKYHIHQPTGKSYDPAD